MGRLVDPATLPAYGGTRASYGEYVAIGIVLSLVVGRLLVKVATAVRREQLRGTLGTVLATPSALRTVQLGGVALDLLWLPLRMALFLTAAAVGLGLDFDVEGAPLVAVLLIALLPFVWGLGLICAAGILAFRGGIVTTGYVVLALGVASARTSRSRCCRAGSSRSGGSTRSPARWRACRGAASADWDGMRWARTCSRCCRCRSRCCSQARRRSAWLWCTAGGTGRWPGEDPPPASTLG